MITPPVAGGVSALVSRIGRAAQAGVDLVQIRQPQLDARLLQELVGAALDASRGTRSRILVNDRVDVALASSADGVHLREQSMPGRRVRTIVRRGFLLGRSVHTVDAARAAAADRLDYVIFGTVFPTSSKAGQAVGEGPLAAAVAATPLPVLAIGGMTLDRLHVVARTGAAGFAAIGLFAEGDLADIVGEATRRWASM
jgi:thiamine-phosphate pyrophosphorylase